MNFSESLKSYIRSFPFKIILGKLDYPGGRPCEERGSEKISCNVAAPRKIIISSILTESHLFNYDFLKAIHFACIESF